MPLDTVVFMAPTDGAELSQTQLDAITAPIGGAQGYRWLAPGHAVDVSLPLQARNDHASVHAMVEEARKSHAIDGAFVDSIARRADLLIADMDSTIIQQECIDEIADFVGRKDEVAAITERAMQGELDFETALRQRVALLKGLPQETLAEIAGERLNLTSGATQLVRTMNASGAHTALISGGFTYFTAFIAAETGMKTHQANTLEIADGALTGTVAEPILGREAKRDALQRLRREHGATCTLAVGDGANDLAMIGDADLGVAFHAKPIVADQAAIRIDHCDLTALLYIQGYTQAEIAD